MHSRFIVQALALLLSVAAAAAGEIEIRKDISYAGQHHSDDYAKERLKLDLYLPKGKKNFTTLVWFHGGGIEAGNKDGKTSVAVAKRFASEGIAVASANYRLYPKVRYPTYIQDCSESVAWVLSHIGEYGGNPENVFVSGHSAGGYLSAMVGLHPAYRKVHGVDLSKVAGYIPVAGQMVTHFTVRKERGIDRYQPIIDEAAPSFHVAKDAPPMLVLVGDNDMAARLEENQLLVAFMKGKKNPHIELYLGKDRNHGTIASAMGNENDPGLRKVLEFIKKHSK